MLVSCVTPPYLYPSDYSHCPDSGSFRASIRDTSERRIQMSGPQRLVSFVLACASSVLVAGAQSQTTPGPEVKKLAAIVGRG